MSAPPVKTIADALATAYSSLTPPSGLKAIGRATAELPNSIPHYPYLTVELDDGDFVLSSAGGDVTLHFKVRLWWGKHEMNQARDMASLQKWLGTLLWATLSNTTLGQTANGVKSAIPSGFRFFVDTYGSVESYGWEIDVDVLLRNVPIA